VNQVNLFSSSVVSVGASHWCAISISHVPYLINDKVSTV
jgi:hypothetical protein